MSFRYLTVLFWFLLPIQSCTNISLMSDNQKVSGHYRLYTYPASIKNEELDEARYIRFGMAITNNLSGQLLPTQVSIPNRFKEERTLKIGGIAAIKTYKDILKEHYNNRLFFIDAGSFLNESENHYYTQFLRNYLEYDAGGIGPGEFQIFNKQHKNFSDYLETIATKSRFDLVLSNLFDLQQVDEIQWKGIKADTIVENFDIKLGVINVILPESTKDIPDKNINGLYFQNAAKKVLIHTNKLKRAGAQVIILIANGEFNCTSNISEKEKIDEDKVNFSPYDSSHCEYKGNKLFELLQQLPPQTVDLVISSGENSKVANYILDYPMVQNKGHAQFLSWVEFVFDKKYNAIDDARTKIFQPIELCHSFLKNSFDCYTKEKLDNEELIPAMFLGKKISIEPLPKFTSDK